MTRQNRRRFLKGAGTTGLALGLAGCVGELESYVGNGGGDGNGNGNGNETDAPANGDESTPEDDGDDGEVLEDFADGVDHWYDLDENGAFEATDDVRNGEQGIRIVGDADEPYAGAVRAFSDPLDLTDKTVSISFRAIEPQSHRIEVQLLAPDQGNVLHLNRTHTGPTDHWMNIDLGATGESGDPDLSEIYEFRLIARDRGREEPIDVTVDEIRLTDSPDQGQVMLTWDDSHHTHARAFEIMEEFGFPGVEGVIHHAVGASSRLDTGELRQMQSAGWDIVSHPHPEGDGSAVLTEDNWSEDEQRQIIEDSKEWLESRGFEDGAEHYITPGNLRDATNMELLREYHESSISFGGGNVGLPLTDNHAIGRIDGTDPETVKEYVDLAEKYNQLVAPMWHTIGDDADEVDITEEEYRDLLEYIDDADVEVVTQSELVA